MTVRRKRLDVHETNGFVIALTDEWVVLHELDGVYLEAVVLLRLDQVTKVEPHQDEAFVMRAFAGLGVPLEDFLCPPTARVGDLLKIASERGRVIGVHLETPKGDWINFGLLHRIGKKRADLQFVGRDGDWVEFSEAWKLNEITRIEFGGRYIHALEQFADPIVPVESRKKR